MKDPLAGYFFGGGNVGFRQKPKTPPIPPDVTPGAVPQNPVPSVPTAANSVQPIPDTPTAPQQSQQDEDVSDRDDENSVDVTSDSWDSSPKAGGLQRDLESLGLSNTWSNKVADFIDPFDKVAETPGITGGYGGDSAASNNYGLAATDGLAQGISGTKQDLGWDLTRYGSLMGGLGLLPGQGIAKRAGGALLDNQIDAIDSSFDALDDDLTGYDAKGLGDTITVSDAYGNVHTMTKGEYEAKQGELGSASLAADYNAGNRTSTQQVGDHTISTATDIWGNPSSFIDDNGDGVQQSNERSVVTSGDGSVVTSGSGNAVTSRSLDEIQGYAGNNSIAPGVGYDPGFDMTSWDDIADDAEWGGGETGGYEGWG